MQAVRRLAAAIARPRPKKGIYSPEKIGYTETGKAEVLSLLRDGEYVSGEEISRALGVTRAAVWKAVQALRADGCSIDSVPNRGYCLHRPESALSDAAVHALLEGCPWPINVLPTVDSTNTYAKAQAALGAPHGSVYVTGRQTGGR